ncbi:MAG: hypothetical protein QN187_03185 [Armatimonadota bacterium]|nr:hypothetical protein [Armatimonadota bacterium]MDR7520818.1 hypothetical protein [Armatimonadota bacterium]MDR7551039.1 hypothetical protein [Armatimonadota bacterium]
MPATRREIFDRVRAGPALFAGIPGAEVDIDRLAAHLAARGFNAGVYASDDHLEGVLWIQDGTPQDTWYFEAGGEEALLPMVPGHHLLRDLAARGGAVSVHIGTLPQAADLTADVEPAPDSPFAPPGVAPEGLVVPRPSTTAAPVFAAEPAGTGHAGPLPHLAPPAQEAALDTAASEVQPGLPSIAIPEPPPHPWPAILSDVSARVARLRGPRLASLFLGALDKALAGYGGQVHGDRIEAPVLPESAWRAIVEAACSPIVAIAGRAFMDRTIAAAERSVQEDRVAGGGAP